MTSYVGVGVGISISTLQGGVGWITLRGNIYIALRDGGGGRF